MDVCIRNISSRGLLVQAASPPARGTYIEIIRPGHRIIGRVVWTKERRFGVSTREPINVQAVIDQSSLAISRSAEAPASRLPRPPLAPDKRTSAHVQQRLERSRQFATVLEFSAIIAVGAIAASIMASTVYESLSRTFTDVSSSLGKPDRPSSDGRKE